jgi:hypothetical protein
VTVAFPAPKKTVLFEGTGSKPLPFIVTTVPTGPEDGEKVSPDRYVNPARVPVANELVILTLPDAPAANTAVILVGELIVKEAAVTPPKLTVFTPVKLVPVNVIVSPTPPYLGKKDEMAGIAAGLITTLSINNMY